MNVSEAGLRVLMLGWPACSRTTGGVGSVCAALAQALAESESATVTVLFPNGQQGDKEHACVPTNWETISSCAMPPKSRLRWRPVASSLQPYLRPHQESAAQTRKVSPRYASLAADRGPQIDELFLRVRAYARQVLAEARSIPFDVIHAHDWMSLPAAMELRDAFNKPVVAHVHSTELERAGSAADPRIVEIERTHLASADAVIAVSHLTRNILIRNYGVDPQKISVVYSALPHDQDSFPQAKGHTPNRSIRTTEKVVLFAGRMTMQKGPEYFLAAARIVAQVEPDVRFVLAGEGDLSQRMMALANEMGIADRVTFAGHVEQRDMARLFKEADAFVMPSVSEPYGVVALEAVSCDVPVLLSRQSGVGEVLRNVLRADFWDVRDLASKIVAMLRYPPLCVALRRRAACELRELSWRSAALQCREIYASIAKTR